MSKATNTQLKMITKMKKEKYDAPVAEALEVKLEGVVCGSVKRNSYGNANNGITPSSLDDDGVWNW